MEEYLIPCTYKGDGYGISVMMAGLNEKNYDSLEVSIDELCYLAVGRNDENPYNSEQFDFAGLNQNVLYKVYGRFSSGERAGVVECSILSQNGERVEVFDASVVMQSVMSAMPSGVQAPTVGV